MWPSQWCHVWKMQLAHRVPLLFQAVEIMSSAIGDLMSSEFTKMRDHDGRPVLPDGGASIADWEYQTELMSASLIAKSCKGCAGSSPSSSRTAGKSFPVRQISGFCSTGMNNKSPCLCAQRSTNLFNSESCSHMVINAVHSDTIKIKKIKIRIDFCQLREELLSFTGISEEQDALCVTSAPVIMHINNRKGDVAMEEMLNSKHISTHKVGYTEQ